MSSLNSLNNFEIPSIPNFSFRIIKAFFLFMSSTVSISGLKFSMPSFLYFSRTSKIISLTSPSNCSKLEEYKLRNLLTLSSVVIKGALNTMCAKISNPSLVSNCSIYLITSRFMSFSFNSSINFVLLLLLSQISFSSLRL